MYPSDIYMKQHAQSEVKKVVLCVCLAEHIKEPYLSRVRVPDSRLHIYVLSNITEILTDINK